MAGVNQGGPTRMNTRAIYQWTPGSGREPRKLMIDEFCKSLEVYVFADNGTAGKSISRDSGLKYRGLELWVPMEFVGTPGHPGGRATAFPIIDKD